MKAADAREQMKDYGDVIAKVVDEAPPLSSEAIEMLRRLLPPVEPDAEG